MMCACRFTTINYFHMDMEKTSVDEYVNRYDMRTNNILSSPIEEYLITAKYVMICHDHIAIK